MLELSLPLWNETTVPTGKKLGEPQSRSGHYREKKNLLPLPVIESRTSGPRPIARPYIGCVIMATFYKVYFYTI
jgi:hypothetical protein